MTYEQAIDEFKQRLEVAKDWDCKDLDYCEALNLGIRAMERMGVGKEVVKIQTNYYGGHYVCPNCKSILTVLTNIHDCNCKWCGQKLKWGDEE